MVLFFVFRFSSRHALFSTPRVVAHEERISGFLQGAIRCRYPFLCYTRSEAPNKKKKRRRREDTSDARFYAQKRGFCLRTREKTRVTARASLARHAGLRGTCVFFVSLKTTRATSTGARGPLLWGEACSSDERRFERCGTHTRLLPAAPRKVAPRRSATSDEDTHKFDSLRFPVIQKTVKPPTHLARGPARRETFRAKKKVLFFPLGFCPPRQKRRVPSRRHPSPVMKPQKGVSQKHHSQCPNTDSPARFV